MLSAILKTIQGDDEVGRKNLLRGRMLDKPRKMLGCRYLYESQLRDQDVDYVTEQITADRPSSEGLFKSKNDNDRLNDRLNIYG